MKQIEAAVGEDDAFAACPRLGDLFRSASRVSAPCPITDSDNRVGSRAAFVCDRDSRGTVREGNGRPSDSPPARTQQHGRNRVACSGDVEYLVPGREVAPARIREEIIPAAPRVSSNASTPASSRSACARAARSASSTIAPPPVAATNSWRLAWTFAPRNRVNGPRFGSTITGTAARRLRQVALRGLQACPCRNRTGRGRTRCESAREDVPWIDRRQEIASSSKSRRRSC